MAAPLNTCTTIEQCGVLWFLWAKGMAAYDVSNQFSAYSVDGDPLVCLDDVFDALQRCWRGNLHRPTYAMFVFDTYPPFQELLHPIMDCLT
jgi:hypothetical protein